mmetsp:Transcript_54109/g.137447  ORF Transcript_54109/g.137447 Transcript_54109/m.137447 type:complete len:101 (-) Transcript_54109:257-559(-)
MPCMADATLGGTLPTGFSWEATIAEPTFFDPLGQTSPWRGFKRKHGFQVERPFERGFSFVGNQPEPHTKCHVWDNSAPSPSTRSQSSLVVSIAHAEYVSF